MVIKLSIRGVRHTGKRTKGHSKAFSSTPREPERYNTAVELPGDSPVESEGDCLSVELPGDSPTDYEVVRVRSQPTDAPISSRQALPGGVRAQITVEDAPPSYSSAVECDNAVTVHTASADAKSHEPIGEGPPSYEAVDRCDETIWDLDQAAEDQIRQGLSWTGTEKTSYVDSIVHSFLVEHPAPSQPNYSTQLDCPVIIPQRRPGNRRRGFVRAYAPVLSGCGIDEATFLRFLKDMYRASQAAQYLYAIDAGALVASLVPEMTAAISAGMVRAGARTAIEIQTRRRTNAFLDQMNDQFFKPRGLFCMIMTNKPRREAAPKPLDISQSIAKLTIPADTRMKRQLRELRTSNGFICGEVEVPEAAPLIFPKVNAAIDGQGSNSTKKNSLRKSSKAINDYIVKRNKAVDYKITVKTERKEAERAQKDLERACKDEGTGKSGKKNRPKPKGVKKMLKQDTLYLMVVNMPREEELVAARVALASEEKAD